MGFPRQQHWSGLPFPPPGHLPNPGIKPRFLDSPALKAGSLPLHHLRSSRYRVAKNKCRLEQIRQYLRVWEAAWLRGDMFQTDTAHGDSSLSQTAMLRAFFPRVAMETGPLFCPVTTETVHSSSSFSCHSASVTSCSDQSVPLSTEKRTESILASPSLDCFWPPSSPHVATEALQQ